MAGGGEIPSAMIRRNPDPLLSLGLAGTKMENKKASPQGEALLSRYVRTNYGLNRNLSLPRLAASLAFRRTF